MKHLKFDRKKKIKSRNTKIIHFKPYNIEVRKREITKMVFEVYL